MKRIHLVILAILSIPLMQLLDYIVVRLAIWNQDLIEMLLPTYTTQIAFVIYFFILYLYSKKIKD